MRREVKVYNLDMVLAVGYRSSSPRAVQFRQWATSVLREYLVKGFAMDDDKLKAADGWDYFEAWLERIRSNHASERRFYQKVRDLYATAIDYDSKSVASQTFFASVQNKMLWAVTGHTAAEIVKLRSDPTVPNMGLRSWSGSVVRKGDVVTVKKLSGIGRDPRTRQDRHDVPRLRSRIRRGERGPCASASSSASWGSRCSASARSQRPPGDPGHWMECSARDLFCNRCISATAAASACAARGERGIECRRPRRLHALRHSCRAVGGRCRERVWPWPPPYGAGFTQEPRHRPHSASTGSAESLKYGHRNH